MKNVTRLGVLTGAIVMVGGNAAVVDITPGGTVHFNGHEYKVFLDGGDTWDNARSWLAANLPGWYLATATSSGENTFIWGAINGAWSGQGNPAPPGQYWLGGFQPDPLPGVAQAPGDDWHWVTGEAWNFTNWNGAEPNDNYGPASEQRLAIGLYGDKTWNDEGNPGNITGFVAEVPEPSTYGVFFGLAGLAAAAFLRNRK